MKITKTEQIHLADKRATEESLVQNPNETVSQYHNILNARFLIVLTFEPYGLNIDIKPLGLDLRFVLFVDFVLEIIIGIIMISRFMSFLGSGFNIWLYLAFNGPHETSI